MSFIAVAIDDVQPTALGCSPASGSTLAVGTTTVSCMTSDAAGHVTTGTFALTVIGASGQLAQLRAVVVASSIDAGVKQGLLDKLDAVKTAIDAGQSRTACNRLTAFANQVRAQTGKAIIDNTELLTGQAGIEAALDCIASAALPVLLGPRSDATTTTAPGLPIATIRFTGPSASVSCLPSSPATLGIGTTEATCTATNTNGSTKTSFRVTVVDREPPVLTLPAEMNVNAPPGSSTAVVNYVVTATDNSGSASVVCSPPSGSAFAWGTTTVSCTAVDGSGNTTTGTFKVTVDFAISGRITDRSTGLPLAGVRVGASQSTVRMLVATAVSGGDGTYSIVVPPGTYRAGFNPDLSVPYVGEWWNGKANFDFADVITVGGSVGGVDAALQQAFFVHGQITDEVTHLGIAQGTAVSFDAAQPCCQQIGTGVGTDANGNYKLAVPKGATVKIRFGVQPPARYIPELWNNKLDFGIADPLTVNAETFGINAALAQAVLVQGTVTDDQTHVGIGGIGVAASECCPFVTVSFASTGPNGGYSIFVPKGVPFQLHFFPFGGTNAQYVGEWFDDQVDFGNATNVTLTADTSGIDAGLRKGFVIRGHVTRRDSGAPIEGINVNADDGLGPCCQFRFGARTDASGNYAMLVQPGTYKLSFFSPPDNPSVGGGLFVQVWWHNQPFFDLADPLLVSADRNGVDQALTPAALIAGRVTDATGTIGVGGLQVTAQDATQPCCQFVAGGQTSPAGDYSVVVPLGASVKVEFGVFSGPPPGTRYLGQWWSNKSSFDRADPIAAAANVFGIDAHLATGFLITGHVSESGTGTALAGVNVQAVDPAVPCCPLTQIAATRTNAAGDYALAVRAGTYKIQFNEFGPPGVHVHMTQWWNGRPFDNTADLLTVTGDTSGINAVLVPAVFISGRVTDATGTVPVVGIDVSVVDATTPCCQGVNGTRTDASGSYSVPVPLGSSVKIQFKFFGGLPPGSRYVEQWWSNEAWFGAADPIAAVADLSGIDAHLASGFFVTGRVTERGTGVPLAGVHVAAEPCCPLASFGFGANTDASGSYTLLLAAGSYKVSFSEFPPGTPPHVFQWWHDKPFDFAADVLTVTGDTSGIDQALPAAVFIRGRVTDATGAIPVSGLQVSAQDATQPCCQFLAGGQTDASGNYSLVVLKGSTAKVEFGVFGGPPPGTHYLGRWWDNKGSFDLADPISAAADVTGIDAHLQTGFRISGHVSERGSGVALADVQVQIVDAAVPCCPFQQVGFTRTDAFGNYSSVVPAGTYKLQFFEFPPPARPHVMQWWNDQPFDNTATPLAVAADTAGIDASLIPGVFIRGRVTDGAGAIPVAGLQVSAQDATQACCHFVGGAQTDASGNYELVVPGGSSVKVEFGVFNGVPPGTRYVAQWWNNKSTFDAADVLSATTDQNGIDARLASGFFIRGRVTDQSTGAGLGGFTVVLDDAAIPCCPFRQIGATNTNGAGDFTIIAPAGSYKLFFSTPPGSRYVGEWWNNRRFFDVGDTLVVTGDMSGLDAGLATGFYISGHVSDRLTGTPVVGFSVQAFDANALCCAFQSGMLTDGNGDYVLLVPGGLWKIGFLPFGPTTYLERWWNDKANFGLADALLISADVGGVDARLDRGP